MCSKDSLYGPWYSGDRESLFASCFSRKRTLDHVILWWYSKCANVIDVNAICICFLIKKLFHQFVKSYSRNTKILIFKKLFWSYLFMCLYFKNQMLTFLLYRPISWAEIFKSYLQKTSSGHKGRRWAWWSKSSHYITGVLCFNQTTDLPKQCRWYRLLWWGLRLGWWWRGR